MLDFRSPKNSTYAAVILSDLCKICLLQICKFYDSECRITALPS